MCNSLFSISVLTASLDLDSLYTVLDVNCTIMAKIMSLLACQKSSIFETKWTMDETAFAKYYFQMHISVGSRVF